MDRLAVLQKALGLEMMLHVNKMLIAASSAARSNLDKFAQQIDALKLSI